MIPMLAPAWLCLAIPLIWLSWRYRSSRPSADILRTLAGLVFIAALSRPYFELDARGRSLVVLVDRSLSMPKGSDAMALEAIRLIEDQRKPGDRLGVISFGVTPKLERLPSESLRLTALAQPVNPSGTDLAAAIATGLESIPNGSQGGLLIFSDGERTGRDPLPEARRAAARGLRIDILPQTAKSSGDLSIERFELPSEVNRGEPFQFEAWIYADKAVERNVTLRRDDKLISRGKRSFQRGMNRIIFRDILQHGGIASYSLEATGLPGAAPDRRPENDRGLAAVRAVTPATLLLLNEDGAPDTISLTLTRAGIPVDVRSPVDFKLNQLSLDAYRAVILENVSASKLGYRGMLALKDLVVERGGGLWMTGGHASFGVGGYYLSPLDDILPVSMEMRKETRKLGLAIAMVLDRSGSMSAAAGQGQTKMDLANAGAAAAIEMLGPMDSVAVIAVDSSAHEVIPLQPIEDIARIKSRVLQIQSQGGGIFTYTGLLAAGRALENAPQENRHIILFADSADAEEPEGVPDLLDQFLSLGITVSVIALGNDTDPDAEFLFQIAEGGDGDIYFTTEPAELPRLFAQDTMTLARSTFIETPTQTLGLPGLFSMGEFGLAPGSTEGVVRFPSVEGYNLTYIRPSAKLGARTKDENAAPFFAFAQRGVGRTAALTGQIGGAFGQGLTAWPELSGLIVSTARYLLGQPSPDDLFATAHLEGNQIVARVEVDPASSPDTSKLDLHITLGDGAPQILPLSPIGNDIFEVRLPIDTPGVALGSIHLAGDRIINLAPVALPYSPEHRRVTDPNASREELEAIAKITGGKLLANLSQAFEGSRLSRRWRTISSELLMLGLLLLLLEIAVRRLSLFDSFQIPASFHRKRLAAKTQPATSPKQQPESRRQEEVHASPSNTGPATIKQALEQARQKANERLNR